MTDVLTRLRRTERSRSTFVLAVLLALAVAALVAVWWTGHSARAERAAAEQAVKVATERAVQITTYTAQTVDDDFGWVKDGATKSFAADYATANEPLREVITRLGASASGKVKAVGTDVVNADEVDVLLFVDQTVVKGPEAESTVERNRVILTMVKRDGTWLVDELQLR